MDTKLEKFTTDASWKKMYLELFNNSPKKHRRTASQIRNIKSQAKIYVEMYPQ